MEKYFFQKVRSVWDFFLPLLKRVQKKGWKDLRVLVGHFPPSLSLDVVSAFLSPFIALGLLGETVSPWIQGLTFALSVLGVRLLSDLFRTHIWYPSSRQLVLEIFIAGLACLFYGSVLDIQDQPVELPLYPMLVCLIFFALNTGVRGFWGILPQAIEKRPRVLWVGELPRERPRGEKIVGQLGPGAGEDTLGSLEETARIAMQVSATRVVVHLPQGYGAVFQDLLRRLSKTGIPLYRNHDSGIVRVSMVDVFDLPSPVVPVEELANKLQGKSIFISGVGGTLGGGVVRALGSYSQNKMTLVDNSEAALKEVWSRIVPLLEEPNHAVPLLSDIGEKGAIGRWPSADYYFHMGFIRDPSLAERNPFQSAKTNILGTYYILSEAAKAKAPVLIALPLQTPEDQQASPLLAKTFEWVEALAAQFLSQIPVTLVRLPSSYVAGVGSFPAMERAIKRNLPVHIQNPLEWRWYAPLGVQVESVLAAFCSKPGLYTGAHSRPFYTIDLAHILAHLNGRGAAQFRFSGSRNPKGMSELPFAPTPQPLAFLGELKSGLFISIPDLEKAIGKGSEAGLWRVLGLENEPSPHLRIAGVR